MEKEFAPTSARLLAYFSLITLFAGSVASIVLEGLQKYRILGDMQYVALVLLALGVLQGLIALVIARDFPRLVVYTVVVPLVMFIPISHFVPSGSDPYMEFFLRNLALDLIGLVLL